VYINQQSNGKRYIKTDTATIISAYQTIPGTSDHMLVANNTASIVIEKNNTSEIMTSLLSSQA